MKGVLLYGKTVIRFIMAELATEIKIGQTFVDSWEMSWIRASLTRLGKCSDGLNISRQARRLSKAR
jgi:hypothetical protein